MARLCRHAKPEDVASQITDAYMPGDLLVFLPSALWMLIRNATPLVAHSLPVSKALEQRTGLELVGSTRMVHSLSDQSAVGRAPTAEIASSIVR